MFSCAILGILYNMPIKCSLAHAHVCVELGVAILVPTKPANLT